MVPESRSPVCGPPISSSTTTGRPQAITTFAEGAFPLTVALGVDRSLSMAGEPIRLAKRAAQSFLAQLGPGDRSMVVAISAEADVVAPLDGRP